MENGTWKQQILQQNPIHALLLVLYIGRVGYGLFLVTVSFALKERPENVDNNPKIQESKLES